MLSVVYRKKAILLSVPTEMLVSAVNYELFTSLKPSDAYMR